MTWDMLLGTVSTLVFSYKRLCGTWALALGLAAARLEGRHRLVMAQRDAAYSSVWTPGDAYAAFRQHDGHDKCTAACGACPICLAAEQVDNAWLHTCLKRMSFTRPYHLHSTALPMRHR